VQILREAKYINLSLHYLEQVELSHTSLLSSDITLRAGHYLQLEDDFVLFVQVIIALQEKAQGKMRTHIPYRNSMMTSVLRDSIGGNCRTVRESMCHSVEQ
jgi:kinesin family protein 6/9